MKRKVNRVGTSTLTVSLPSKWVKKYGVNVGDEIDVSEQDACLVVNTKKTRKFSKKIDLNLTSFNDRLIKLALNNLYREGFDQLNIKFDSSKIYKTLYKYCNNLIGFEIIKKSGNFCVIESVIQPDAEKFDSILRRSFLIIKEGLEVIQNDLKDEKFENLSLIMQYSAKASQYINFCMRNVYNHSKYEKKERPINLMLFTLINIKATNRRIYEFLDKKHFKIQKDTLLVVEKIIKNFNIYYNLFYKKETEKLIQLNDKLNSLLKEFYDLSSKKKGDEAILINLFSQMVRLMVLLISPTTVIVMERKN